MARTLETILIGRDLLSPVLTQASGSVKAYDAAVTSSQARASAATQASSTAQASAYGRAAEAATAGGRAQQAASGVVVGANERAAGSATASSAAQQRAHAKAAESATLSARAQQAAVGSLSSANGLLTGGLTPLTAGLGAVALGLGYAAYRGAQFDSAMSAVQAATMATGGEMENLRDLAIKLGADTQYSAEEAAQGITELAKAGVDTADIMGGGLAGALDLAAAGQLDVADAAEIAATQMVVFNLKGDQMSHVADLLAAGAGKAQGSVQDMALALQYAGLPAAGLGISIEETTGALGLFASTGLVGERAGTSFRSMLVSMTNPAAKTRTLMDELNLSFFDGQGQFIGMAGVAQQLKDNLGDLTQEQRNAALAQIFGNEAVGAAQALYNNGAAGVARWTANVDDAGYAAEQAARLNDNLRGDLEKLGGAFDAAMTSVGEGTQGPLRLLVQTLTSIIDAGGDFIGWISELPGPVQAAAIAIGAIYIAAGPLSGLFPAIALNARVAFATIQAQAALSGGAMGLLTASAGAALTALRGLALTVLPFAVVGAAIGAIARMVEVSNAADDAREHIDELTKSYDDGRGPEKYRAISGALDQVGSAAGDARRRLDELNNMSGWDSFWTWDHAGDLDIAQAQLDAAIDALDELNAASGRADQSAEVLGRRYNMTRKEVEDFADAHGIDLSGSLQIVQTDFMRVADASGLAASGMSTAADGALTGYENFATYAQALSLSDEATEDLNKKTMDLAKSMADFIDPLGAYTTLLDAKKEAERSSAEAAAVAAGASASAWEDYVGDVTVSFDQYMQMLEDQVTAQQNWETNMLMLAGRVSQGTLDQLARMGPEGAPLVAQLVDQSDEELVRFSELTDQRSDEAVAAWRDNLNQGAIVLAQVAAMAGQGVANSLAAQLTAGTTTVAQIAQQYGIAIADGVNPVLQSLGQRTVSVVQGAFGFGVKRAQGGPVWGAGTATSDSIPAMLSNGEYVIRASSVAKYGVSTLDRINSGQAQGVAAFANGGFATSADVPAIRSTAPYGAPISTVGDAGMQSMRDAAVAFLDANAESVASVAGGPAGSTAIGGGWQTIWNIVKDAIPQARINSTYRPGDPGYHGRGKAIDFGFGSGPGGAGSAGLASIAAFLYSGYGRTLAELIYDGIGDSTPDVKNGQDHTYNAATRAQHANHVHAAVYANGGLVAPGGILNPHVRDQGGPLLPGYTFNGLNRPETVVSTPAAAMPGYGTTFAPSFTVVAQFGSETMTATAVRVVDGRLGDLDRQVKRK